MFSNGLVTTSGDVVDGESAASGAARSRSAYGSDRAAAADEDLAGGADAVLGAEKRHEGSDGVRAHRLEPALLDGELLSRSPSANVVVGPVSALGTVA
jgi:hypothetical protein